MRKNTVTKIIAFVLAIMAVVVMCMPLQVSAAEVEDTPARTVSTKTSVVQETDEQEDLTSHVFNRIPKFNQRFYDTTPYGNYGTVASHGCGIVCVSMIATYLTDSIHAPEIMAYQFGDYNTSGGSYWKLFQESAEELGLPFVKSDSPNGEWYDWNTVKEALENGQPVVCLQKAGLFTRGGHYIVLTGITEDGKILVNDPNGDNWQKNATMIEGFTNGFTEKQIRADAVAYWIYGAKEEPENVFETAVQAAVAMTQTTVKNLGK